MKYQSKLSYFNFVSYYNFITLVDTKRKLRTCPLYYFVYGSFELLNINVDNVQNKDFYIGTFGCYYFPNQNTTPKQIKK